MNLTASLDLLCKRTLDGWRANPDLVQKDAREEESLLASGYHDRQVLELVQNAADAALGRTSARIELRLTDNYLYAANTGDPLSEEGLRALILGGVSPKGGEEVGRFGLGFRSLLRLGGRVDMVSAGTAFRFDPAWCADEARKAAGLPKDAEAPGMRLAQRLDLGAERRADPLLDELLEWADTVVRAELEAEGAHAAMARELERFPAEFLLFPSPDLEVVIHRPEGEPRTLRRERQGDRVLLRDGRRKAPWRVLERRFRIDDPSARADAGRLHARGEVTIRWAVPVGQGDPRGGELWNAFPTRTPSVVPGILDTRWKLNSDRTALTGEAWNAALMRCAAELIARSLPGLASEEDPGLPIALLPRQLERKDEPAAPLHDALWAKLREVAFVASAAGRLHRPNELHRPPTNRPELHERWRELASEEQADRFVHPRCFAGRERPSRLEQLSAAFQAEQLSAALHAYASGRDQPFAVSVQKPMLCRASPEDWVKSAAKQDPATIRALLSIIAELIEHEQVLPNRFTSVPILLTEDGQLVSPSRVAFPGPAAIAGGLPVLHPELAADETVRDVLVNKLGVKTTDEAAWLQALEDAWPRGGQPADPERGWKLLRDSPEPIRAAFVREHRDRLRLKTCAGSWRSPNDVLLVGSIIQESEIPANADIVVDRDFARRHDSIIKSAGVSDKPKNELLRIWSSEWNRHRYRSQDTDSKAIREAEQFAITAYIRKEAAYSARYTTLGYVGYLSYLSRLGLLSNLKGKCRARLTSVFLDYLSSYEASYSSVGGCTSEWTEDRYPPIPAPDISAWVIWKYGTVEIGERIVALAACSELRRRLAPSELAVIDPLLPSDRPILDRWPHDWPRFTSDPAPVWEALLASRHSGDHEELRPLWQVAARHGFAPESVPGPAGQDEIPLSAILVTTDPADHALAARAGVPAVLLDEPTARVWRDQGAQDLADRIRVVARGARSAPVPATEAIPGLAEHVTGRVPPIVMVERIERTLGTAVEEADLVIEDGCLLVSRAAEERRDARALLRRKLEALATLTTFDRSPEEVVEALDLGEAERLRAEVAAAPDLPGRLLRAAGGPEPLRASLPEAARRALDPSTDDAALAQLCLDLHGPGALRAIRDTLAWRGLRPPERWGSDEARRFVAALGFPLSFAGAANPRLEAELQVMGPTPLPPLHPYQEDVLQELGRVVGGPGPRQRAVLSLPTGAGKTRVAVEAAVRRVLRGELGRPLVVWVAQTEELAEQAVEAFRQVWANEGLEATELRIVRFWGGQPTPPESAADQPTVVVSLIQTLTARLATDATGWLATATLLVIDESHHGIAPSYTDLLRALGFATGPRRPGKGEQRSREPALLGLTATPFRSRGEDETRRLAQRFDARVVPREQTELHTRLRAEGYLARVAMEPLAIEEPFALTAAELEHYRQYNELPESALVRLAERSHRNAAILQVVAEATERSVLLFANTVEHAVELAARLSLQGIRARPVSGATDRSARREAVAAFRRGEIRVITNAQIFSTGFDAPSVDMILIARPVFSPVRFMQMVGRGLRGPKNGGTAHCRVVTVRDNIIGYSGFDPLDWWRRYYE